MNSCLTSNQNYYSNDETDDETTMPQSGNEPTDDELSQSLTTPNAKLQKAFGGRSTNKKIHLNPTPLEELRDAYNHTCSTELTRFLWKRVEEQEGVGR